MTDLPNSCERSSRELGGFVELVRCLGSFLYLQLPNDELEFFRSFILSLSFSTSHSRTHTPTRTCTIIGVFIILIFSCSKNVPIGKGLRSSGNIYLEVSSSDLNNKKPLLSPESKSLDGGGCPRSKGVMKVLK